MKHTVGCEANLVVGGHHKHCVCPCHNFVPNPAITKKVMEDYEKVRQSGKSNMFDTNGVTRACLDLKCTHLLEVMADDLYGTKKKMYVEILRNFSKYMKLYDIKQPKR